MSDYKFQKKSNDKYFKSKNESIERLYQIDDFFKEDCKSFDNKYKLKDYGYCTRNNENRFEVFFTVDSLWKRLFKSKTSFVFTTNSSELKIQKYLSDNCGLYYCWFDEKGKPVTNQKLLNMISLTINLTKKH